MSDEEGHYRIRGLKPSFEYVLSIKMKEHSKVDHFIPSEFKYSSDITDIHDATFIAIYKPDTIVYRFPLLMMSLALGRCCGRTSS